MARTYHPRSFHTLLLWRKLLRGENGVGMQRLVHCWRHGFYPDKALTYDFATYPVEEYFPDRIRGSQHDTDSLYASCSEDKITFFLYMTMIGANTPQVLVENAGGRLIHYAGAEGDLDAILDAHGELVIKPRSGRGGQGVRIVQRGEPGLTMEPGDFASTRVHQHDYAATIYPDSANTIRVLTAWDYAKRDSFVAAAVHRFGSSQAKHVDNWSRGGLSAWLDLDTARLGPAVRKPGFDAQRRWWASHPDTGQPIEGVEVPRFSQICAELLDVCRRFPSRYLGWDIVVTPESWSIIEANRSPALGIFQVHRPLLADARLRDFFMREGML